MKIAFWSNSNDLCKVTANLAAISTACVMRYPYSVITMENRLCHNNLGTAFFYGPNIRLLNEAGTNYYDGGGIEGLMRKIYRGDYHTGMLKTYLKDVISRHLYYIPQTRVIHNEIFDYEFDHCVGQLLQLMEEYADICMIDTASNQNLSTKTILEKADLIVVNLCQKQNILEDFFVNYSSMLPKAAFIISSYDCYTKYSIKKISSLYDVPLDNISVIPDNEFYENAFKNGSVVEFISRNYTCPKGSANYNFLQAVKKATHIIVKKAALLNKQKEIGTCFR